MLRRSHLYMAALSVLCTAVSATSSRRSVCRYRCSITNLLTGINSKLCWRGCPLFEWRLSRFLWNTSVSCDFRVLLFLRVLCECVVWDCGESQWWKLFTGKKYPEKTTSSVNCLQIRYCYDVDVYKRASHCKRKHRPTAYGCVTSWKYLLPKIAVRSASALIHVGSSTFIFTSSSLLLNPLYKTQGARSRLYGKKLLSDCALHTRFRLKYFPSQQHIVCVWLCLTCTGWLGCQLIKHKFSLVHLGVPKLSAFMKDFGLQHIGLHNPC